MIGHRTLGENQIIVVVRNSKIIRYRLDETDYWSFELFPVFHRNENQYLLGELELQILLTLRRGVENIHEL